MKTTEQDKNCIFCITNRGKSSTTSIKQKFLTPPLTMMYETKSHIVIKILTFQETEKRGTEPEKQQQKPKDRILITKEN